ncbi:MAG: carboxylesterase family protein [Bacteroides stercoris]
MGGHPSTVFWGDTAPQITTGKYRNTYTTFTDHWNYYGVSEDCLMLNIWTPALADTKKRPVLVWIHGGGFTNGNSIEQDSYRGENLSRYGDIVFVSLNHRLGPIGFSDFSGVDEKKFAESGNVGILDLVAGLKWVHNNIAQFGGDPSNVTIMGQSGGGAKVCTLVAMAETKGLLHKAVALSGNITGAIDNNYSTELGKYILKEAGLPPSQINKLQEIPWLDYIVLANRAAAKYDKQLGGNGMMRGSLGLWVMASTSRWIHFIPIRKLLRPMSPCVFSTTTCEFSISRDNATLEKMNRTQLVEMVDKMKGKNGQNIVLAYEKAFPDKKPIECSA